MKISMTFDFDLRVRKALSAHYGGAKPATHAQCRGIIDGLLTADIEVITSDYDKAEESAECENCGCHPHLPKACSTCECMGTF